MPNVNLPPGARGIWIDAAEFRFPDGTWTLTRGAAGNYYQLKTAGAATTHPYCNLSRAIQRGLAANSPNAPLGVELQSGGLFTDFDLVYSIATAGLTSLTPSLYQTSYAAGVAPSVATPGGVLTPTPATPVATNAQPYVVRWNLASPYIIGNNVIDIADFLELAVVDPGTSVFALYGVFLRFNVR